MRRLVPLSVICTLLMAGVARSTTVIPPTFESLVSSANTIFVGEVMNVRAAWIATPSGRAIVTQVTFKVEETWKGAAGAVTQLEFLGGTIGETTMEVVGMPTFRDGQRSVLFVSPQPRAARPLVGFWHGRMRVERDHTGVDRVRTYDGRSLGSPAEIGAQRPGYMTSITPMRLTDLESAVRASQIRALSPRSRRTGRRPSGRRADAMQPPSATYLDSEGAVIWLTEYARQRVGQCSHDGATTNTLNQITSNGSTLVCATTPLGPIPFPPRNEGLLFMNQLDATYHDSLRRSLGSSVVNNEGAVVWVLEYLRYRLNSCNLGDATTNVLQQIRGQGIQPTCTA